MAHTTPLLAGDPAALGEYRLTGRIGEGGQGSVYLGVSPAGEQVAIKVLRSSLVTTGSAGVSPEDFLRETEILARVAPFCTAQVIGSGTAGGRPYIVSEFVDGPNLQQVVRADGPLRGTRLRRLAVGTMTALAAIHRAGVVHRDFKPGNVLLGRDGPRVIDFGIARALDTSLTGEEILGTPPYMAPEQLEAASVEPPADLFAWASTMVFAATGRPPFGMDSLPAVVNRILHRDPDLGDLPELDPELAELVADCLAKDPARRPSARRALLRLLGAAGRPAGGDLLSAGTAAAAGPTTGPGTGPTTGPGSGPTTGPRTGATTGPTTGPGTEAAGPVPPAVAGPDMPLDEITVRRRSAAAPTLPAGLPKRRGPRLAAAAAALALVSAGAAYALVRAGQDDPHPPPVRTAAPRPIAERTGAPPPATADLTLPGTKAVVHENPADPVRLTYFQDLANLGSTPQVRDPRTGRFRAAGQFNETLLAPDGWTARLPLLKESTPEPYDTVRLTDPATGRVFLVRLADKPLQDFNPYWSPDGRRLLLTTFRLDGDRRQAVGFAVVDRASATAKVVPVAGLTAGAAPFMWVPGTETIARRHVESGRDGMRFYDLTGRVLRFLPGLGTTYDQEGAFAPAGRRFVTTCPEAKYHACVWDTATGRRLASFSLPVTTKVIGWYNDAHLIVRDTRRDGLRLSITDLAGRTVRALAEIPRPKGYDGASLMWIRYTATAAP
ncbi:hypothetical protein Sru01_48670 [Sphaerisporangium rufum]|uniref:Protein kinase domain-containing protein n=1 Tax=Sphaerisporangium rufum TaxID=1381558 RepID=A0A919R7Z9_9ACTN|nr:serine/threonine-protein kinase [Sphaerisporangium rufum]GII79885.1 hypothetical protein Sru01_48670 [Sphaerisporangium rufum]